MCVTVWSALMWILVWSGITLCWVERFVLEPSVSLVVSNAYQKQKSVDGGEGFVHDQKPRIFENCFMGLDVIKFCLMLCEEGVQDPCQKLTTISQVDSGLVISCLSLPKLAPAMWNWSFQSFPYVGAMSLPSSWVIHGTDAIVRGRSSQQMNRSMVITCHMVYGDWHIAAELLHEESG